MIPMRFHCIHKVLLCSITLGISLLSLPPLSFSDDTLVVYSGRAERLIKPVLDAFQAESGITIQMLTADTTALSIGSAWKANGHPPMSSFQTMLAP